MEDKRGFSLVEGLMVMLILCIVLGSLFPLMLLKKKIDGRDTASINCIRTEGGNLTSQSCINAVNNCKYEKNNGCNNLKYFADLGNDSEKAAALAVLKKTCDEGGETACKYFVHKCKDDSTKCNIASDNDLNYYLQLPLNDTNLGKMKLNDTLTEFYNNNIENIVTAVNDSCCATGTINFACAIKGTTTCDAPNAPTGLSATAGVDVISLSWTDNSSDEEGFKVYQSIDGTTYSLAATVGVDITTATLNNLDPGTYYLKVVSYIAARNSTPSNIVTVTIGPLNAPSGLTNTVNGTDAVLNWTDNSSNETGFKIYKSSDGGSTYTELGTVGANTTTYTATGLAGGDHLFKVVAINDGTNSADSNTTTATISSSTSDIRLIGRTASNYAGYSVASAGDVNGDNIDDILIGAWGGDDGGADSGETYLIMGRFDQYWTTFAGSGTVFLNQTLSWDNSTVRFIGRAAGDQSGWSVSSAGDVNNDTYDDILIGARGADGGGNASGETYLIMGRSNGSWTLLTAGSGTVYLNQIGWNNGTIRFIGRVTNDQSGYSVSSAGDVNNDTYDDFLIGAPNAGTGSGETYLIMGRSNISWTGLTGGIADVYLNKTLSWSNSTVRFLGRNPSDQSGYSVSSAGDVNNDGYDDFLIGAYMADGGGFESGEAYLILGRINGLWSSFGGATGTFNLDYMSWVNNTYRFVGRTNMDFTGQSVSSAGDVNNDGYDDILIGAPLADGGGSFSGETYLIMGRSPAGWSNLMGTGLLYMNSTIVNWANSGTVKFFGRAAGDNSGQSVSSAGDVNNDGYDDILIGAPCADGGGAQSGETYLIMGRSTGSWASLAIGTGNFSLNNLSWANSTVRFIGRFADDRFGQSVGSAGNVNFDGYSDILIGANLADGGGFSSGETYLIRGRSTADWGTTGGNYFCNATWPTFAIIQN